MRIFLTFLQFILVISSFKIYANPIPITTSKTDELVIHPRSSTPATVLSLSNSIISSQIQGQILNYNFQVGDTVKQNDIICTINCEQYLLEQKQIDAQINSSKKKIEMFDWQLKRKKTLANQNNFSAEGLIIAKTSLFEAKSILAHQTAQKGINSNNIRHCSVKAPFSGTIVEKFSSKGELANIGTPLMRIVDTYNIELQTYLQPKEIQSLKQAEKLIYTCKDGDFEVKLRTEISAYDNKNRTQEARLIFINKRPLSGSAGRLTWQDAKPYLPANLLVQHNNDYGIYLLQNDEVEFLPIKAAREGKPFEIPQNINSNIIIDGRHSVTPGVKTIKKDKNQVL
jgi:RND family efflux transporter MFP subunit